MASDDRHLADCENTPPWTIVVDPQTVASLYRVHLCHSVASDARGHIRVLASLTYECFHRFPVIWKSPGILKIA